MKILVLPRWGPEDPRSRYRIYQYLPYLADAGHQLRVASLSEGSGAGASLLRLLRCLPARSFDLAWIQSPLGPGLAPSLKAGLSGLLPQVKVYDSSQGFHGQANGLTLETGVDPGPLPAGVPSLSLRTVPDWSEMEAIAKSKQGLTLGWVGSQDRAGLLEDILPVLQELAADHPFELKMVGASIADPGFNCSSLAQLPRDDRQFLASLDMALLPCAVGTCPDFLQRLYLPRFMAAGIPVVVGPGNGLEQLLAESGAGYVAEDGDAWMAALRKLFHTPSLGPRLGERGREWAKYELSLQAQAPGLVRFLESLVQPGKTGL